MCVSIHVSKPANTLFWSSCYQNHQVVKIHDLINLQNCISWHTFGTFSKERHPSLLSFKHLFVSNHLEIHPERGEPLLIFERNSFSSHLQQKHFHTTTIYFL